MLSIPVWTEWIRHRLDVREDWRLNGKKTKVCNTIIGHQVLSIGNLDLEVKVQEDFPGR